MRTTMGTMTLAGSLLAMGAAVPGALAQGSCKGVVKVDSVYQNSTGGGAYKYFIQVRNETGNLAAVTLEFGGFGGNVSLFSASLPHITLKPKESKTIAFGTGSDGKVNTTTVKVYYDVAMSLPQPYALAKSCSTVVTK